MPCKLAVIWLVPVAVTSIGTSGIRAVLRRQSALSPRPRSAKPPCAGETRPHAARFPESPANTGIPTSLQKSRTPVAVERLQGRGKRFRPKQECDAPTAVYRVGTAPLLSPAQLP